MRSEVGGLALAVLVAAAGCKTESAAPAAGAPAAKPAPPARFAGVAKKKADKAAGRFCEKTYPAAGAERRAYQPAPTRALPGGPQAAGAADAPAVGAAGGDDKAWTWVNVWATWCTPCLDEMSLLGRWQKGLKTAGTPIELELLSVDQTEAAPALAKVIEDGLPGPASWLRSADDLEPFMKGLGVDAGAALPVHALVDPAGAVRCVRVGAIHDRDYGSVKALLAGG